MSARDLRLVLDVARELGDADDVSALRTVLLAQLRRLVPYDIASWNDTLAQLHRLDLYDAVYRGRGIERQIAFTLPAAHPKLIGIALSRRRQDFSERDRRVLEPSAPLVGAAHARVAAIDALHRNLTALERATDELQQAVVAVRPDGRIQHVSAAATALLSQLPGRAGILPEPIASWHLAQGHRSTAGLGPVPLAVGDGVLHYVPGGRYGFDSVVLTPCSPVDDGAMLAAGLARRERQVLRLVAAGATNVQVAGELAISERTVAKHLEHAYRKLEVSNRTAAIARVRGAMASIPPGDA